MSGLSADDASLLATFQQRQEGMLERKKKRGFSCVTPWVSEWFVVSTEYIVSFVSRTSGQVQLCVCLSAVTSVEPDVKAGTFRLRYAPQIGKSPCDAAAVELVLKASKEEDARQWVTAITEAQERRRRDSTFVPFSFVQERLVASQQVTGDLRAKLAGADAEILQAGKSASQAEIKARHELACQSLTAVFGVRERTALGSGIACLASHASSRQSYHAAIAAAQLAFALEKLPRTSCASALSRWRGCSSEPISSQSGRLRQWHRNHTSFRACCSRSIKLCEAALRCEVSRKGIERKALLQGFSVLRSRPTLPQLSSAEIQTETVGMCSEGMQTDAAELCSEAGVQAGVVCSYASVEMQTDAESKLCSVEMQTDAPCTHASVEVQTDGVGNHASVEVQTDGVGNHASVEVQTDDVDKHTVCSCVSVDTQTSAWQAPQPVAGLQKNLPSSLTRLSVGLSCQAAEPQVALNAGASVGGFGNSAVDAPEGSRSGTGVPPLTRDIPLEGRIAAATSAVSGVKAGITKLEERLGEIALRTASSLTTAMAAAQAELESQEASARRAEGQAYERRWWLNLAEVVAVDGVANDVGGVLSQAESGRGPNDFAGISNEHVAPSESSFSSGIAPEAPGTEASSGDELGSDGQETQHSYQAWKSRGVGHRGGAVGLATRLDLQSSLGHFLVPKACSAQRPVLPPGPCGLPPVAAFQLARSDSSTSVSETASDAESLVRQYANAWH